jgi:hypothetical protein
MDEPNLITLTTIEGTESTLQVVDNDYVRVLGVIPHGSVFTAENLTEAAIRVLRKLAPNTLSEDSQ